MIYNDFKGYKLSLLGLGMMRLPVVDGDNSVIDKEKTQEMIDFAYENGINYFDTAWMYHNGTSEEITGRCLSKYPRDTYYLATKFPGFNASDFERKEEIFEEQLRRCNTEYFDFYLFHSVSDDSIDLYLDPKYGLLDYLLEQKKNGKIKHLGFSTHGSCSVISRFLESYGEYIEFCQLQFNYMDWHFQNCEEKYRIVTEAKIPVWVMEPVRGGRLVNVSDEMLEKMKAMRPDETAPSWAFRFLQSFPEVKMVLSGMSDMKQLKENIETFSKIKPLTKDEMDSLISQIDDECKNGEIPCTSCRYCTKYCPKEIDIPSVITLYNQHKNTTTDCIGCKKCEKVCPQGIKISKLMKEISS